jgi:hypothetical protein
VILGTIFTVCQEVSAFNPARMATRRSALGMKMSMGDSFFSALTSLPIADTSISEEEVLAVTGQTAELPDPIFAIVTAFALLAGIGLLQFSLGDLTKEVCLFFSLDMVPLLNDSVIFTLCYCLKLIRVYLYVCHVHRRARQE